MVFKPFKPPFIRNTLSATPTLTEKHDRPSKKPRVRKEDAASDATSQRPTIPVVARKPLVQVKNVGKDTFSEAVNEPTAKDDTSDERYFIALWRNPSAKKHKTWDGDGILCARGGYVYLRDVGGRDMGRSMLESRLEPGTLLSLGGKEVEVESEIPRGEYLSGKRFLEGAKSTTATATAPVPSKKEFLPVMKTSQGRQTPLPTNASYKPQSLKRNSSALGTGTGAKKITPTFGAYKKPLLEDTVIPQSSGKVIPRHDPKAPGALVMPRLKSVPKGKQIVDVVVDPILSKHLRKHQREGVQFLYECVMGMRSFNGEGAILADDMGLGKTLQTIALLWTLLKQNPVHEDPPVIKKALIVCPVTLINNWRKEFRKWLGNERIGVFVFDDKRKRLTDFTKGRSYNIMIVGYEKLRTVQEGLARGAGVDIIIADEGHRLKTLQNKSGQAIQSLNAAKRIILSGTPIQNDLREFFAAVDLVNPGILGTFKAFIREFETPIVRSRQPEATKQDIEKGEARTEELRELTSKFILRRTADVLAKYLPPKSEYVLFCKPTRTQANIYQSVLASPIFQCALGNAESALQLITILKKLCNSPSLLSTKNNDDSPNETIAALLSSLPPNLLRHFSPSSSAKLRVLDQLLHQLRTTTSEKIVLVSNYTSTLNLLANLLNSLGFPFLRLDGRTPAQKRQPLVDDFNRLPADACFAFLLSAKAGGTGLNLIGASRLVLFDVDWNPATDIQAMARIHRDGQKRPCRIYRVLLKGSLEEKIWQRQVTKLGLADSVMENKNNIAQFSTAELRDLFRLDEESTCQTHELLGCDCGGRGVSTSPPDTSNDDDDDNLNNEDGSSDLSDLSSSDELPDFPTLIKASQVNMNKQERALRAAPSRRAKAISPSTSNLKTRKQNEKMHQSLAQYAHLDPSLLITQNQSGSEVRDADAKEDSDFASLTAAVDDDVLLALLKGECNSIGYIFKKASGAQVDDSPGAFK